MTTLAALPPTYSVADCIKCGTATDDARIEYCPKADCLPGSTIAEHHHRTCRRCQYRWLEAIWVPSPSAAPRRRETGGTADWRDTALWDGDDVTEDEP